MSSNFIKANPDANDKSPTSVLLKRNDSSSKTNEQPVIIPAAQAIKNAMSVFRIRCAKKNDKNDPIIVPDAAIIMGKSSCN